MKHMSKGYDSEMLREGEKVCILRKQTDKKVK